MSSSPVLTHVRRAWSALADSPPGLVIAVSGGPDSVALVRALVAVRADPAIPLVLAHLNHQLRGSASEADEAFVRELHAGLAAPQVHLACHRLDIAALAQEQHDNLEAVARRERYRWLAEVARTYQLHLVATGHTANDQAETVLHRLLRGTGLEGLRGIAARRPLEEGIEVVRPLLSVTREEVQTYLAQLGQEARHDSTNDDVRFMRNRLRHELLPLLARDYNPRIVEVLGRLAQQADEICRDEEQQAEVLLAQVELPRAGPMIVLDVERLRQTSRRQVRDVLRRVWRREGWPMAAMGFFDYQRVAELIDTEQGAHDLPGGVQARRVGRVLQLHAPAGPRY
jgi:tRNA(Ile)-lysidine synthase